MPGCYGAIHDPAGCTCEILGSGLDRAQAALARAEERINCLQVQLRYEHASKRSLLRNSDNLREEIRELRGLPTRKKIEITYPCNERPSPKARPRY